MDRKVDEIVAFKRWVALAILISFPIALIFAYFGQTARGETAWFCTLMILVAVRLQWDLRHYLWFWIAVAVISAIHVPLIIFFPWTKKDYPGLILMPVGLLDCAVVYGFFKLVEKAMMKGKYTNREVHPQG